MCDLPNGEINYGSRISTQEAYQLLEGMGVKPIVSTQDGIGLYHYAIPLSEEQKESLRLVFPKRYHSAQGGVLVFLNKDRIEVDGDIRPYNPRRRTLPRDPVFCSSAQSEAQKSQLTGLVAKIEAAIEEFASKAATASLKGTLLSQS